MWKDIESRIRDLVFARGRLAMVKGGEVCRSVGDFRVEEFVGLGRLSFS